MGERNWTEFVSQPETSNHCEGAEMRRRDLFIFRLAYLFEKDAWTLRIDFSEPLFDSRLTANKVSRRRIVFRHRNSFMRVRTR